MLTAVRASGSSLPSGTPIGVATQETLKVTGTTFELLTDGPTPERSAGTIVATDDTHLVMTPTCRYPAAKLEGQTAKYRATATSLRMSTTNSKGTFELIYDKK